MHYLLVYTRYYTEEKHQYRHHLNGIPPPPHTQQFDHKNMLTLEDINILKETVNEITFNFPCVFKTLP
jgi:hypothetical protein